MEDSSVGIAWDVEEPKSLQFRTYIYRTYIFVDNGSNRWYEWQATSRLSAEARAVMAVQDKGHCYRWSMYGKCPFGAKCNWAARHTAETAGSRAGRHSRFHRQHLPCLRQQWGHFGGVVLVMILMMIKYLWTQLHIISISERVAYVLVVLMFPMSIVLEL